MLVVATLLWLVKLRRLGTLLRLGVDTPLVGVEWLVLQALLVSSGLG
jgi:hypothetical protein